MFSLSHLRVAFGFAAAALLAGAISQSISHHHRVVTYVIWYAAAGFCVLAAIALTAVIERRRKGASVADEEKHIQQGARSIYTEGQSGGVNWTGDIVVSAPQPSVKVDPLTVEKTEAGYVTTVPMRLQNAGAAENLVVVVEDAPSLTRLYVGPVGAGVVQRVGGTTATGGHAFGLLRPVSGDYLATISTTKPEPHMKIAVRVNEDLSR